MICVVLILVYRGSRQQGLISEGVNTIHDPFTMIQIKESSFLSSCNYPEPNGFNLTIQNLTLGKEKDERERASTPTQVLSFILADEVGVEQC